MSLGRSDLTALPLQESLADVPDPSVSRDWLRDGHMTQFKPMRAELGTFAETFGKETLEFLNWEHVNLQLVGAICATTDV